MEDQVTAIIEHMAKSQEELARILEAERHVTVRMANIVHTIPDQYPGFEGVEGLTEQSIEITKTITNYLNGLADLEEALADNLSHVINELSEKIPEE